MQELQEQFDDFLAAISLGSKQRNRINSAFSGIQTFLCSEYEIPNGVVFVQGSCANGTAIKPPPDGDYDLDVVVRIPDPPRSADEALEDLESILEDNGIYAGKVIPKKPCVRLEYADDEIGGFHIDLVPARHNSSASGAPLQAPRRGEGWHDSPPLNTRTGVSDKASHLREPCRL